MSAKFWLEINRADGSIEKRPVRPQGHIGVVEGACPGCGAEPFHIQGGSIEAHSRDVVRSGSRCTACDEAVGWAYGKVSTVFGVEEDLRMTRDSRARVYV